MAKAFSLLVDVERKRVNELRLRVHSMGMSCEMVVI